MDVHVTPNKMPTEDSIGPGGAQMQTPPEILREAKSLCALLTVFYTYVV